MTAALLLAAGSGLALGLGIWSLVALLPRFAAPRLSRRIASAVGDVSPAARALVRVPPAEPAGILAAMLDPVLARAAGALRILWGGDESLVRLLRQAGETRTTVSRFRARQLAMAIAGAAVGVLAALLASRGGASTLVSIACFALALGLGVLLPDRLLAHRAATRRRRLEKQLPVVLDLIALGLSAGASIGDALARAATIGGDLAGELRRAVTQSQAGVPLGQALDELADELRIPALGRSVEQLVAALDRGAPLAEVLRAQADDARDEQRRRLIEAAGTQEVTMLVPLVLLILPVTVLFALAPAALVLELG